MNLARIHTNTYFLNSKKLYFLLLLPVVFALLAIFRSGFVYQSGTACFGILILLVSYYDRLKQTKDVWMIIAALLFSIAGDLFLSNKETVTGMFVTGIIFYFFAHIGYLLFALMNGGIKRVFTILLLTGYLILFSLEIYPYIENSVLLYAAFLYLIVSCLSLGAAVGLRTNPITKWAFVSGILLILFSDTIIAYQEFVGYKELNFLILPTYYLAHIAIVFSLMKRRLVEPGETRNNQ